MLDTTNQASTMLVEVVMEVAAVSPAKPRVCRFNGRCRNCKRNVSVGVMADSRLFFSVNGLEPMVAAFARSCGPVRVTCLVVDSDGFWRPAHGSGKPTSSYPGAVPVVVCCEALVTMVPVKGVFKPDHKCDARCVNAKGHNCECSCGGQHHGSGFSL